MHATRNGVLGLDMIKSGIPRRTLTTATTIDGILQFAVECRSDWLWPGKFIVRPFRLVRIRLQFQARGVLGGSVSYITQDNFSWASPANGNQITDAATDDQCC